MCACVCVCVGVCVGARVDSHPSHPTPPTPPRVSHSTPHGLMRFANFGSKVVLVFSDHVDSSPSWSPMMISDFPLHSGL